METYAEIPIIKRIVADEKWLLGEELGFDPGDLHPELVARVSRIILEGGEGKKMRESSIENYNETSKYGSSYKHPSKG